MKTLPGIFLRVLGGVLLAGFSARAADALDPGTKAAQKAGDTTSKKIVGKTPTAPAQATAAKTPLKAWPEWIPQVAGLKLTPDGKKWTEEDVEHGALSGTAPGAPREIVEAWTKAAREVFRGVTTNDATVNGALTLTVSATYLKEEQLEHKVELEIKPAKGGKTSVLTLTYTIGGEP